MVTLTDADMAGAAGGVPVGTSAPRTLTDADMVGAQPAAGEQSYVKGLLRSLIGQGALMGWGDEVMGRLRQLAGEDYETARNDERAKVAAFRKENPKTALAAELGGGFLTPGLGLLGGVMKPAATVGGKIWQGTKIGAGAGALSGAGATEGDPIEAAKHGAILGAPLGGLAGGLGAVVGGIANKTADAVAPTLARAGAKLTRNDPGEAAADSVLKSWMRASGDTPESLRKVMEEARTAGRFYSNSSTDVPLTLADLSPSMQKLAGSVVRASPEAANAGSAVLGARQTGVTPKGVAADVATAAGIAHRNPLAAREADQTPAGMFERIGDALKRAFTIKDADFHGFGPTAYKTEQAMMARLKQEADKLYGTARRAGQNVDISATIEPIMNRLAVDAKALPVGEAGLVNKVLRQFTTQEGKIVTSIDGFDKAKRVADGLASRARLAGDKNAERVITGIKNELISAVDGITTNGLGEKYKAARNYFSSEMEMKDALDLGRKALREDAEIVADQIRELTEGQKKLFRLGLHASYVGSKGNTSRAADVTRIFETPRMQEILEAAIPRSQKTTAEFSDRPERFGDFINFEKLMSGTKNKVFGNSMTAERLGDDARFTRQTIGEMFDRYRSSPSLFAIGMEAVSTGLNKVFGFRDDVAKELARRLFMADAAQRDAILKHIESQWGSDKLGALLTAIGSSGEAAAVALPSAVGRAAGESRK